VIFLELAASRLKPFKQPIKKERFKK